MTQMTWRVTTGNTSGPYNPQTLQQISISALQKSWTILNVSAPNVNWSEWAAKQDGGPHFVWVRKENTYWVEFLEIWCNGRRIVVWQPSTRFIIPGKREFEVSLGDGRKPYPCTLEGAENMIAEFLEKQLAS